MKIIKSIFIIYSVLSNVFAQNNAACLGPELITNGDFSLGNVNFTTDYTNCETADCLFPLADNGYSVGSDVPFYHSSFEGADHTSGSGNMMIINGGKSELSIWTQTINVNPNTSYAFSIWVCSVYNYNIAQLNFKINGVSIGNITAPSNTNEWINFSSNWNSKLNSTANISIIDDLSVPMGNDFGLDDISFHQYSPPKLKLSSPTKICQGVSAMLTCEGANTYTWTPMSALNTDTGNQVIANPSSTITYTVVGNTNNCYDTALVLLTVNSLPALDLIVKNDLCATEFSNNNSGLDSSLCDFGDGTNSHETNPSHIYSPGQYQVKLTVKSPEGCRNDAHAFITRAEVGDIYLPNAFSPINDGKNDFFFVRAGGVCFNVMEFVVYNRWGESVFETDNPLNGWDGKQNEKDLNTGIYFYKFSAINNNGKPISLAGNISLVR